MSVEGGVAVAVAVAHTSAWKDLGLKLNYVSDLSAGQGQKRKASEVEGEDNTEEECGVSEDSSNKKERKRRRESGEREPRNPGGEGQREKENRSEQGEGKKDRGKEGRSRRDKDKGNKIFGTEDANTPLLDKDKAISLPPDLALPSPPRSNTVPSSSGSPPKPSLRKRTVDEKRLLRKSVTFTSDTKATDGDSIKTLYQNYDPFAHYDSYQQHISNYPTNELPEGFDDIKPKFEPTGKHKKFDEDEGEKASNHKKQEQQERKRKRKKKKAKKPKKEQGESVGAKEKEESITPQLSYLLTYHTCREAWKFEKSKQNWILRNAFSPSMIPQEGYSDALKSYIAGVQGTSARDRLLSEANEIVKHGKDTISKDGDKLDVTDQKNNVIRAKLVLAALGHCDDEEGESGESDSSSDEE